MREYKFRGRDEHGVWHYGYLANIRLQSVPRWDSPTVIRFAEIVDEDDFTNRVDPETVGQFTGLKDSDGREIYEGDVVEATLKDKSFVKRFHMDETVTGKISFDGAWWLGEWDALWRLPRYYDLTVIGNIHDNDNPELLEATE